MAGNDAVQSWWDGLSPQEQDDAMRAQTTGRPSESMQRSMEEAGLVEGRQAAIPDHVLQHLAEKGTGRPDDSADGGKMRH